jgi:hypothetical protein
MLLISSSVVALFSFNLIASIISSGELLLALNSDFNSSKVILLYSVSHFKVLVFSSFY